MIKLLKFQEHQDLLKSAEDFLNDLENPQINESNDDSDIHSILTKIADKLKLNKNIIDEFSELTKILNPLVEKLLKNSGQKIDLDVENLILLTFTACCISYLDESGNSAGDEKSTCGNCQGKGCGDCSGSGYFSSIITKEVARNLLEELKLSGIGNGIVKKLVANLHKLKDFISKLVKKEINFFDLTNHQSIVSSIETSIDKNKLGLDNFVSGISSLQAGIKGILSTNPDRLDGLEMINEQ